MRNPNRIPHVLSLLRDLWQTKFPDMRFFQFVDYLSNCTPGGADPFYLEDDELIELLRKLVK